MIQRIINENYNTDISTEKYIISILIVTFSTWFILLGKGLYGIKESILQFIYGSSTTIGKSYSGYLEVADLTIFQLLQLILLRFGSMLIIAFLILLIFILILKNNKNIFKKNFYGNMIYLYLILILVIIFSIFMSFLMGIITNPIRNAFFPIFICAVIIGYFTSNYFFNSKNKIFSVRRFSTTSFFLLITISIIISIFNIYPSPITWSVNSQTTESYMKGEYWFIENRNINLSVSEDHGSNFIRMEQYYNFTNYKNRTKNSEKYSLPNHFGYNNENISINFNNYIINTKLNKISYKAFPENVRDKVTQFNKVDFVKINNDSAINKIYDNREFEVRYNYDR
jgi:hypothetical protein